MVAVQVAPIQSKPWINRKSICTPTGTYYMVGTPSVDLVKELIAMDVRCVMYAAREPGPDWKEAEKLLVGAGIEVVDKQITSV